MDTAAKKSLIRLCSIGPPLVRVVQKGWRCVPVARIALLDAAPHFLPEIAAWFADGANTIWRYEDLHTLLHDQHLDIVIFARTLVRDGVVPLRRLRCRWSTVTIVVTDVIDEADAMRLICAGPDHAVVAGSPTLQTRLYAAARRARTI